MHTQLETSLPLGEALSVLSNRVFLGPYGGPTRGGVLVREVPMYSVYMGMSTYSRERRPEVCMTKTCHTYLSQTHNSQLKHPDAPLFVLIILGRIQPKARRE